MFPSPFFPVSLWPYSCAFFGSQRYHRSASSCPDHILCGLGPLDKKRVGTRRDRIYEDISAGATPEADKSTMFSRQSAIPGVQSAERGVKRIGANPLE